MTLPQSQLDRFSEEQGIVELIEHIKRLHPNMEYVCTHGSCFRFYELLVLIYPEAEAYINAERNHVVTKLGNSFYDITGRVGNVSGKASREYHRMDETEFKTARKWKP